MGVIAKQSIRGALANYLGIIIGAVTTFFVLTDCLTQQEIGLTRVMVDAALLFSGLAQLGTNASIIRYYPYFKDPESGDHGFFGWTILLPFVGFSLFAVLFFVFKEPIVEVYSRQSALMVDYIYLLLPLTFFALFLTVFETNSNVLLHITVPKVVREVGIRLLNLVAYLLYGHGLIGFDLFVVLFCSSYAVAALVDFVYLLSLGKISFRIDFHFLNKPMLRQMGLYTLFMTATVLAANIPLINSLFLGAKSGLQVAGVYAIASYIANIVEVPYRSLGAISQPLISQAVKEGQWGEVNRLGRQVSLHQLLVSSLLFFFIWINLDALFALIPHGEEYAAGIGVIFFLGLAKIVNSSMSIGTNILNFSNRYPASLVFILLLTVSAIWLNQVLIQAWGIDGSAIATLLSYVLYFGCLHGYLAYRTKVVIFSTKQLWVLAMVVALFAVDWLWRSGITPLFQGLSFRWGVLLEAVCRSLCFVAVVPLVVYKLRISEPINEMIHKLLKRR